LLILLGLPLAALGCGPSDAQVGAAVLVVSPLFVGISWLLLALLAKLWRRVESAITMRHLPAAVVLGATLLGLIPAFAGPARWTSNMGEYVMIAFAFLGSVFLFALLVTWRVWFAFRRNTALTWVVMIPAVAVLPATLAALDGPGAGDIASAYIFTSLGGFYGWPVLLLLMVGLIIEPFVRGRSK